MFFLAGLSFILALKIWGEMFICPPVRLRRRTSWPWSTWTRRRSWTRTKSSSCRRKSFRFHISKYSFSFYEIWFVSNCRRWISSRTPHQRSRTKRNLICTHSKTNSDDKINNSDELIVLPSTTWSSQARAARDPLQERPLPSDEWCCHLQVRGGSWKVRPSTMITIGEDNNDNDQNHDADNNHDGEASS